LKSNENFAFETTLSTKSYKQKLIQAKANGFKVKLLFFWLPTIEMAINRVAIRVSEGGHHIPSDVIERRYSRGIVNLFKIYIPLCDSWMLFDNEESPEIIAKGLINEEVEVFDKIKWNLITKI
jgi:predicted ABC-type ATPase